MSNHGLAIAIHRGIVKRDETTKDHTKLARLFPPEFIEKELNSGDQDLIRYWKNIYKNVKGSR